MEFMKCLQTIDYTHGWNDEQYNFDAQLSYTILDWANVKDIVRGRNSIHDVDSEQKLQIAFSIFPPGTTIFHKLGCNF